MQYSTIFILTLFFNHLSNAQTKSSFLNLELLGNAQHISINYDSRFNPVNKGGLGYRVGLGSTWSSYGVDRISVSVPVGINYLIGKEKSFIEMGLVGIPEKSFIKYAENYHFTTRANLGYRYISKSGLMLNALWTPRLTTNNKNRSNGDINGKTYLWFGFGAGIRL